MYVNMLDHVTIRYLPIEANGDPVQNRALIDSCTNILASDLLDREKLSRIRQILRLNLHNVAVRKNYMREDQADRFFVALMNDEPCPKWVKYTTLSTITEIITRAELNYSDFFLWLMVFLCNEIPRYPTNVRVLRHLDDYIIGSNIEPHGSPSNDIVGDITKSTVCINRIMRFVCKDMNWNDTEWVHEAFNCMAYTAMIIYFVLATRSNYNTDIQLFMNGKLHSIQRELREKHSHVDVFERKEIGNRDQTDESRRT